MRRLSLVGLTLCAILAGSTAVYAQKSSTLPEDGKPASGKNDSERPDTIPEKIDNTTDCCKELRKEVNRLRIRLGKLEVKHVDDVGKLNGLIGDNAKAISDLIPIVQDNTNRSTKNVTDIAGNRADIDSNINAIGINTAGVAANDMAIADNKRAIAKNASDLIEQGNAIFDNTSRLRDISREDPDPNRQGRYIPKVFSIARASGVYRQEFDTSSRFRLRIHNHSQFSKWLRINGQLWRVIPNGISYAPIPRGEVVVQQFGNSQEVLTLDPATKPDKRGYYIDYEL